MSEHGAWDDPAEELRRAKERISTLEEEKRILEAKVSRMRREKARTLDVLYGIQRRLEVDR